MPCEHHSGGPHCCAQMPCLQKSGTSLEFPQVFMAAVYARGKYLSFDIHSPILTGPHIKPGGHPVVPRPHSTWFHVHVLFLQKNKMLYSLHVVASCGIREVAFGTGHMGKQRQEQAMALQACYSKAAP